MEGKQRHPGPEGWFDLVYRIATRLLVVGVVWAVLAGGLILGMGLVAVAWLTWETRPPSQVDFEAERWKDPVGDDELRWRMHKDLIKRYKLVGMTEQEVLDLLVPDCQCGYFANYDLVYWMGPEQETLFQIDSVWLAIDIGPDGRVIGYDVLID